MVLNRNKKIMEFKELMDALAQDAGMTEPVAYEDDSSCHLDINDRDFGFLFVAEAERLVVWTAICERPPESGMALLVQLLRANFMNPTLPDGALSLSEDNVIFAHCALKMPVFDKAEFYALLKRFVTACGEWHAMIELAGQANASEKAVRPDAPSPAEDGMFFRV